MFCSDMHTARSIRKNSQDLQNPPFPCFYHKRLRKT